MQSGEPAEPHYALVTDFDRPELVGTVLEGEREADSVFICVVCFLYVTKNVCVGLPFQKLTRYTSSTE